MTHSLAENASSAILMHVNTGKILFEKNMNERLPPASLTKIMTLLLIFEELKEGRIRLTDKVGLSPFARSVRGSKAAIEPEEELSVEDLIKCIVIASANNAAIGMAEYIAGSCEEFVSMMGKKAGEMNLKNSQFLNPHGLNETGHYSSAFDMAILSEELLKGGEILNYSSKYKEIIKKDSKHRLQIVNTNKLLRNHPEIDGLKTGYTRIAKACISVTAIRDNNRVLAVVMGEPSRKIRNKEIIAMLGYAWLQIYG
ncbi:D-alanyl-D-alanine carboxypeptidase family protein [Neobacillus sp. SAB-20_R2A]|uniref:D-alanyl-D-alanine carboxypeptidase family protein n=1 Tax=Neobacillus sp. SAB-20_R2A TaxID=3120519 RepID=UPI003C6E1080